MQLKFAAPYFLLLNIAGLVDCACLDSASLVAMHILNFLRLLVHLHSYFRPTLCDFIDFQGSFSDHPKLRAIHFYSKLPDPNERLLDVRTTLVELRGVILITSFDGES